MRFLFIHQNFPGQFVNLAIELANRKHEVTALTLNNRSLPPSWNGVKIVEYSITRGNGTDTFSPVIDFETKAIRGASCYSKAMQLKSQGYFPDVIICHPGWGESLFLNIVWPNALLKVYCEFFYHLSGADVGFDPEFEPQDEFYLPRVQLKNHNNLLHATAAHSGISPTEWQASTFPDFFRKKISVIHDGIDTDSIKPALDVKVTLPDGKKLTRRDEVVTFVGRALEPYRGFHIFMRSLPAILEKRENLTVLVVGEEGVSYGGAPPNGQSWKTLFLEEIRPLVNDQQYDRIVFLGKVSYPAFKQILCVSTVHIYLTYPFVLSWSLLEAMSSGCAIVGSKTSPVEEVIENEKTGILVNFFEHEELSEGVLSLLENQEKRSMLGGNARGFIKERYDLKTRCLPKQIGWAESP